MALEVVPTCAQHARRAGRYGLVRVRENAESIAFYSGEAAEGRLLFERLGAVVANYVQLIRTSRNLEFFTSFYRRGPPVPYPTLPYPPYAK